VLLECAERTIIEDCTMGLSYLLNLDNDYLINITNISESLPQIELYDQVLAYFYSITLYSKMYPEINHVFMYDPIELILHMSNIETDNDTDDINKLKSQINFLIKIKEDLVNENIPEIDIKKEVENDSIVAVKDDFNDNKSEIKKKLTLDYIHSSTEMDEWDNWDDGWIETCNSINNSIDKTIDYSNSSHLTNDNLSIEKSYEIFEEELSNMHSIDDYQKLKLMLIQWSNINNKNISNSTYSDLTLKMVIKLIDVSKESKNNNEIVLKEIKDLLQENLIPQEVWKLS
jgi:hypothetical protein